MEYERGRESSKHLRTNFAATYDEVEIFSRGKSSGSFSSSDSSSSLELDIVEKGSSLAKSEETDLGSRGPISSPEVHAQNSVASMSGSVTQSPPIQMMGRPVGYDPSRIPASVFGSKPATPIEWSVASNESLFSIHMGTNSFSTEHILLVNRFEEVTKLDEANNFPANLPPVTEAVEIERMSASIGRGSEATEDFPETTKVVLRETTKEHSKEKLPPAEGVRNSVSTSYRSDGSGNSIRSFAFPLVPGEDGRNSSVKVETQWSQPQPQPQTPGATQKAAGTNWFPWFSCCPFRFRETVI